MPHFFVNATLILIGILGLFIISLMLGSYRSNIFVNFYLAIAFIICSIRNMVIGFFEITDINIISYSKYISPIYLIVFPALYLYFKSLLKDYKRVHKKDLIHLIYPALHLVLSFFQAFFPILDNPFFQKLRFISLILFILFYSTLSFRTLYKGLWKSGARKFIEKRHYQLIKNWTLFLFIITSLLFLRVLYAISFEKLSNDLFEAKSFSFMVIVPWLLIYGKILINPQILSGFPKLKKRKSKIQNQDIFNEHVWIFNFAHVSNIEDKKLGRKIRKRVLPLISDIENFVTKEHPFRNSRFSFSDFSKAIRVPTSHLNYIFKYHAVVTFVEYREYCRIKDSLALIDDDGLNSLSLKELSLKVGFNSYKAYYSAFKKQTGISPKDYFLKQNKASVRSLSLDF
ncbi:helix-turn-helix domain-containing protein [Mariniflexile ostreae]|uniref:Helix-turn-helix domain-containing protein n=1 Tax=Mariniflexile ostreae TaxID=1520892 RepID=A0ABV5F6S1_9FLAO